MYHSFAATMYGDSLLPFQTKGYSGKKWTPAAYQPYDAVEGDKGIFASAYDLFLFDQALNHELLLKKETLNEAYAGYSFEKPGLKNYGLGWRLRTLPDSSKLIYHNGWWGGYTTSFLRVPEENISIIVLCNKYNKSTYLLNPLLQILGILPGDEMND
jgi:CubicO group peptidase (beta-lactamase class C family)